MNKQIYVIIIGFILMGCVNLSSKKKLKSSVYLNKNEIKELVDIVSQNTISKIEKDSISNIIYDHITNPLEFDSIHRDFNYHQAPNLKVDKPTVIEWNSYEGNKKIWQSYSIDYLLYEFGLTGSIDGFSGVIITLENSKHGNTIDFSKIQYDRYDFEEKMIELDKILADTKRMLVVIDMSVYVIKIKDFKRFEKLINKAKLEKITTYNNVK